jgi:large subunit ribosomal protein L27
MAKTKAKGKVSQKSQRKRSGKRRGVKIFGGQEVHPGNIIVRQVGTKFHSGDGTKLGRDFTIYATRRGVVKFTNKQGKKVISVT